MKGENIVYFKYLLNLRYRVEWRGLEHLNAGRSCLLLPNHPAEVDPLILLVCFWQNIKPRPVILEKYIRMPLIGAWARAVGAIPLPDLDESTSANDLTEVQQGLSQAAAALRDGDSLLLYPSGRLMRNGSERLYGASSAFDLMRQAPDARVLLVRISGLFGSRSSTAHSGGTPPHPLWFLARSTVLLLLHGVFFMPKRHVLVEIEPASPEMLEAPDKRHFNALLEAWYGKYGVEGQNNLTRTGTHTDTCTGAHTDTHTGTHPTETPVCDPDIWEKVRHKLSEMSEQPLEQIHLESSLRGDLCLDSIQLTELAFWTAEQFKYRPKLRELKNAASICSAAKKGTRT